MTSDMGQLQTQRPPRLRPLAWGVALACLGTAGIGCIQSGDTKCSWGEVYCPAGTVCNTPGRPCVLPAQLEACKRYPDFHRCFFTGQASAAYWCQQGVCVPSSTCGNGVPDAFEACDDGNTVSGDGCSADCRSAEFCGNGYADVAVGEECDDGNLRSLDGCSSACAREVADWKPWTSPFAGGRYGYAMAYDTARQRIVLFGGWDGDTHRGDTWEHDGTQWRAIETAQAPPPRYQAGLAYDAARQVTVLHGGKSEDLLGDTWEYDGVAWVERSDVDGGPPRYNHALAYDTARQRVVLYGGLIFDEGQTAWATDTREYDGVTWQDTSPAGSPPELQGHAMTYDAARGYVVAVGGLRPGATDTEVSAEAWAYDGTTWALVPDTGVRPPARYDAGLTYDASRQRLVLFGGAVFDVPPLLADTWEHDGAQWIQRSPPTAPGRRTDHQLVYDPTRHVTVLYGGYEPYANLLGDTWQFDGGTWAEITPPTVPPARGYFGLAYDRRRRVTVLFGGTEDRSSARGDTWEFDGQAWRETTPGLSPIPREQAAMAYDEAREQVVLYGGKGWTPEQRLDDTWAYADGQWTLLQPAQAPSPRRGHAMAYDAARQRLVLFGGLAATLPGLDDTWEFDGDTWAPVEPALRPPARFWHTMAYDEARQRILLFGGWGVDGMLGDLWAYDGSAWEPLTFESAPTGRILAGLAYDSHNQRTLLYGGVGTSVGNPFQLDVDAWQLTAVGWEELDAATAPTAQEGLGVVFDRARKTLLVIGGIDADPVPWEYRYRSPLPSERCANGRDDDGDSLADCEDPDCHLAAPCQPEPQCASQQADPHAGCAEHRCGGRLCAGLDQRCVASLCQCSGGVTERDCGDGQDNDCDGAVDCQDADCAVDDYCRAGGPCPVGEHYVTCGDSLEVDSLTGIGAVNQFACAEWPTEGPETFVHFIPRTTGRAVITLSYLEADLDLVVLATTPGGACDTSADGCLGVSQYGDTTSEKVELEVIAHRSYIIAVDGSSADSVSPFRLNITCP